MSESAHFTTTNSKEQRESIVAHRLWLLFDAAKALCDSETPENWAALYRAVADVPESVR
jgi:hypothetical protein